MASKQKVNQGSWDPFSEQPYPIRNRYTVFERIRCGLWSHVKSVLLTIVALPAVVGFQGALSLGYRPKKWIRRGHDPLGFMGIAVGLDSCDGPRVAQEIEKLGVQQILLRFPLWEMDRLEEHWDFVESLPDCEFVLCPMQDREHILDHDLWRKNLNTVVQRFWPRIKSYQIGQGINRSKWGFFGCDEFLAFASVAEELRSDFHGIQFVGPCVLDFEPVPFIRSMLHGHEINWDVVGCALYVDRRGCPRNRQLLIFNLTQKIYHFVACVLCSNKSSRRLWITEVNWPLEDQGVYSPTGRKECVDEETAAAYLNSYYEDAWQSEFVERVYWWQLISRGYGLIDVNDDNELRYRPAYYQFQKLLTKNLTDSDQLEENKMVGSSVSSIT
ncbi:hypothetical protein N8787_02785 [Opitutaceae bacterium]|nr:hypothetical protein [Opitutaceae bacterium]